MAPVKPSREKPSPKQSVLKPMSPTPITRPSKTATSKTDNNIPTKHDKATITEFETLRPLSSPSFKHLIRELLADQLLDAMSDSNGCAVAFLRSWIRNVHRHSDFAGKIPFLVGAGPQYVVNEDFEFSGDLARYMERRKLDQKRARGEWNGCNTWGVEWGRMGLEDARSALLHVAMEVKLGEDGEALTKFPHEPWKLQPPDLQTSSVSAVHIGPRGKEVVVDLAAADDPAGTPIMSRVLVEDDLEDACKVALVALDEPGPRSVAMDWPPEHGSGLASHGHNYHSIGKHALTKQPELHTWMKYRRGHESTPNSEATVRMNGDQEFGSPVPSMQQVYNRVQGKAHTFERFMDGSKPTRSESLEIRKENPHLTTVTPQLGHKQAGAMAPNDARRGPETSHSGQGADFGRDSALTDLDPYTTPEKTLGREEMAQKEGDPEQCSVSKSARPGTVQRKDSGPDSITVAHKKGEKQKRMSKDDIEFAFQSAPMADLQLEGHKAVFGGLYNTSEGRKVIVRWYPTSKRPRAATDMDPVSVLCERDVDVAIEAGKALHKTRTKK